MLAIANGKRGKGPGREVVFGIKNPLMSKK